MGAELTQALALGVGASGALVQIADSLVRYEAGVTHSEGRSDAFRPDTPPGTFTVTLDNYDGRFTPDNTAAAVAAGYSQALSEGSAVCWSRGGKLWAGTVRGFEPADEWGLVTLTCDDMLGTASRVSLPDAVSGLVQAAGPYLWWPLDDAAGSPYAASAVLGQPAMYPYNDPTTFGGSGVAYVSDRQIVCTDTTGAGSRIGVTYSPGGYPFGVLDYPSGGDLGWWGCWMTLLSASGDAQLTLEYNSFPNTTGAKSFQIRAVAGSAVRLEAGVAATTGPIVAVGAPHYYSVHVRQATSGGTTTLYAAGYVDGVMFGSELTVGSYTGAAASNTAATPTDFALSASFGTSGPFSARFSNLSLTKNRVPQEVATATTETDRITALAAIVPSVSLSTLPTDLSSAPISGQIGGSVLDALNDVIETEQGYLSTTTSGTLTAPTQTVTVRERTRPPSSAITSSNTFDAITEIKDVPRFLRDLTYTVESYTASGPNGNSATYTDADLIPRVGTASDSGSILNTETVDLYGWAADRVVRGANIGLRAVSIEIDSLTTPTDRSADLLALKQGDRIRIANIPSGPTGFTTWDGWIIGIKERYVMADSGATNTFEFLVTPVLPDTGIYNTSVYDSAIYAF